MLPVPYNMELSPVLHMQFKVVNVQHLCTVCIISSCIQTSYGNEVSKQ